jgi:hypothetical protein
MKRSTWKSLPGGTTFHEHHHTSLRGPSTALSPRQTDRQTDTRADDPWPTVIRPHNRHQGESLLCTHCIVCEENAWVKTYAEVNWSLICSAVVKTAHKHSSWVNNQATLQTAELARRHSSGKLQRALSKLPFLCAGVGNRTTLQMRNIWSPVPPSTPRTAPAIQPARVPKTNGWAHQNSAPPPTEKPVGSSPRSQNPATWKP